MHIERHVSERCFFRESNCEVIQIMISVIVPVYKTEKYLERCLESLVNQTYHDLEIVLVDDGSPDRCPQLCDEWAQKDSRIRVVHKANAGLGYARNSGLDAASGEWVSFIDSDDYVETNLYETCMCELERSQADVCYFEAKRIDADGKPYAKPVHYPSVMDETTIRKELLPKCFGRTCKDTYMIGSACKGIYRRKLLAENGIRFVSERQWISEDYIFTAEVCAAAKRIAFLNEHFYNYCMNEGSLTHSYRKDRFERIAAFYHNRVERIGEMQLGEETVFRAGTRYWEAVIGGLKQEAANRDLSFLQKMQRIRAVGNSDTSQKLLDCKVTQLMNRNQQILLTAFRMRWYIAVYLLLKAKA